VVIELAALTIVVPPCLRSHCGDRMAVLKIVVPFVPAKPSW
jgi:hypothetical protein